MARLTTATRQEVTMLHQQGLSQAKVSKQRGASRNAVCSFEEAQSKRQNLGP